MKCPKSPLVPPKQQLEPHEMSEVTPGSAKSMVGTA
jgi:hypothetical protein